MKKSWCIGAVLCVASASVIVGGPVGAQATSLRPAQATSGPAAVVFRRFSRGVVKIQVTSNGANAKAELGSGFFVDSAGQVITNYHVISKLVLEPKRYHADLTDVFGTTTPVTLVAIDVVHDLALLRSRVHPQQWLLLDSTAINQGERLYALGHPQDLGLSIVEGTYNGLLEHTLYPKIHFTGSVNSGMSGGPALTSDGHVVGITVETEGNGIGFLVPVSRARDLVTRARQPGYAVAEGFLADAARQIHAYQDIYLRGMFLPGSPTVQLGSYRLPNQPAPFFKCWADAFHDDKGRYDITSYQCSTSDELFISEDQQSGVAEVTHQLVSTTALRPLRFYALYADQFSRDRSDFEGDEKSVTNFECDTHNVIHGRTKMRVAFCVRAYKQLPGLYDAMVRVATLGATNTGVVSTLRLSGVSFENAQELASRYVGSITWIQ